MKSIFATYYSFLLQVAYCALNRTLSILMHSMLINRCNHTGWCYGIVLAESAAWSIFCVRFRCISKSDREKFPRHCNSWPLKFYLILFVWNFVKFLHFEHTTPLYELRCLHLVYIRSLLIGFYWILNNKSAFFLSYNTCSLQFVLIWFNCLFFV